VIFRHGYGKLQTIRGPEDPDLFKSGQTKPLGSVMTLPIKERQNVFQKGCKKDRARSLVILMRFITMMTSIIVDSLVPFSLVQTLSSGSDLFASPNLPSAATLRDSSSRSILSWARSRAGSRGGRPSRGPESRLWLFRQKSRLLRFL